VRFVNPCCILMVSIDEKRDIELKQAIVGSLMGFREVRVSIMSMCACWYKNCWLKNQDKHKYLNYLGRDTIWS